LKKKAKLLLDPEPEAEIWTGEAIEILPQAGSDAPMDSQTQN
jgi:hypothetical protein